MLHLRQAAEIRIKYESGRKNFVSFRKQFFYCRHRSYQSDRTGFVYLAETGAQVPSIRETEE